MSLENRFELKASRKIAGKNLLNEKIKWNE